MNKRLLIIVFDIIAFALLFILSFELFMRQINGEFVYSDLVMHIRSALDGSEKYSISPVAIRTAYNIAGKTGCGVYFSILVIMSVFTSALVCKECSYGINGDFFYDYPCALLVSVPFMFLANIYIPHFFEIYYLSADFRDIGQPFSICTQPWHNSTYLLMRVFAPLVVFAYFRIDKKIRNDNMVFAWEWIILTLFLIITNISKPNFYLFFAPAVFFVVLYDYVKSKGRTIKTAVIYGAVLLCSGAVLIFQSLVLYGEGASDDSSIIITMDRLRALSNAGNLLPMLVSGLLFAVVSTAICLINKDDVRLFAFVWLMFIVSICESIFLRETGIRENDLNFNWGMLFASYLLNMVCMTRLIALRNKIGNRLFAIALTPLILMICTGIRYFWLLMTGDTFIL